MNLATVFGILAGVGILSTAVFFSTANPGVFLDLPGLAIVLGGTAAATFICYPLREVMRVLNMFLLAVGREELPIGSYIDEIVRIARTAQAKGKVHLERSLPGIDNMFLRESVQMLVDGYNREEIKAILDTRIAQAYEQEMSAAGIYRNMARLAPAFGIMGTLVGIIGMLQAMGRDPTALAHGMAVALTTTFYGVILANLFFLPIAVKVERRIEERAVLMMVIRDGVLFIYDKTPAAIVLDKLKGYLPPRRWDSIQTRRRLPEAMAEAPQAAAGGGL